MHNYSIKSFTGTIVEDDRITAISDTSARYYCSDDSSITCSHDTPNMYASSFACTRSYSYLRTINYDSS